MNEFYLRDETHSTIGGKLLEVKDVLYFKQSASGFDNKATSDHVKMCPSQFQKFLEAHPSFVLPEHFKDVAIGQPQSVPAVSEIALEVAVVEEAPIEIAVVKEVAPTEVPVVDEVAVAPVEEVVADVSGTDF